MKQTQKCVLVTGSSGQLGSQLKQIIKSRANQYPLKFIFTDVSQLDISQKTQVRHFLSTHSISYIINCAAYTAVDKAEDNSAICYSVNCHAVANLAEVAAQFAAKIIHISTDYVFDGKSETPYTEEMPVSPTSVYGKSKAEGEAQLLQLCPHSIIIRTAWLYSTFGNNFVKTILRLARENKTPLQVVNDQTGTPTNAADLAQAILSILMYSQYHPFMPGIYHFTDEGSTTWFQFAQKILHYASITDCPLYPVTTQQYPTKAMRPLHSVLDKHKIKQVFGLKIPFWEDSLNTCIQQLNKTK